MTSAWQTSTLYNMKVLTIEKWPEIGVNKGQSTVGYKVRYLLSGSEVMENQFSEVRGDF